MKMSNSPSPFLIPVKMEFLKGVKTVLFAGYSILQTHAKNSEKFPQV